MREENEKRMAGDYTIFQSFHIGDREVVIGERQDAPKDERYMCAFCEMADIFSLYFQAMVSDDYPEIVELYGQRIMEQAQKAREETGRPKNQGIDDTPLTAKDCRPITHDDDINDRLVVIRPDVLRREYCHATHQIVLCTGGFGASPHGRGRKCFCVNLYTGESYTYQRQDILGIMEQEQLPEWAQRGLADYHQKKQAEKALRNKDKGAR